MENLSNLDEYAESLAQKAKKAFLTVRTLSNQKRSQALLSAAKLLRQKKEEILLSNKLDIENARGKISFAMLDRLTLNEARLEAMAKGAEEIANLPDPLEKTLEERTLPNGVRLSRKSVPIGSILFIYESRPNVTIDGAALCLKSGNAVILRGGKESLESSKILVEIFREALSQNDLSEDAVQLVENPAHELVSKLLQKNDSLDLVIPRGGERLIRAVVEQSKIPVIKHFNGICHIFVEKSADIEMAQSIVDNAKTQRPGTCNAMETLLLDNALSDSAIEKILFPLREKGVEIFGDEKTCARLSTLNPIGEETAYGTEFLSLKMNVRLVESVQEATLHIAQFSSKHTDAIITQDENAARFFLRNVDSSSVMVNASTRLADGGEYGLGAEVGISTDKLHARGPMGVESLCTYQWILQGEGQIRV